MRHILLHPQLRFAVPRLRQGALCNSTWIHGKSQASHFSNRLERTIAGLKGIKSAPFSTSRSCASEVTPARAFRKGPPERILVYYGGTSRTMFLGVVRVTTIILFGAACTIAYQLGHTADYSYMALPIIIGGSIPFIFVAYTSAPHVSFIHLALPAFARRSREAAIRYVNDLPPTANLFITTMRLNSMPRQTPVRLGELVGDKNIIRPVSFRNTNPAPRPWWMAKSPAHFFTMERSKTGRPSPAFYPEFWPKIYERIQSQTQSAVSRPPRK